MKTYYEWQPGWKYVHEVHRPPGKCANGQYRSVKQRGTQIVICCPIGTTLSTGTRCCKRKGKCVSKAKLQSLRHTTKKFARKHPSVWRKLQTKHKIFKGG